MNRLLPLVLIALALPALAEEPSVSRVTWDLLLDGRKVGTRTATVSFEPSGDRTTRVVEATTAIDTTVGPLHLVWKQRLTSFGDRTPASFQSRLSESGARYEVQARWAAEGWTITHADGNNARTELVAPYTVDLSTADLMDPGSRWRLDRYTTVKVLSAETGEIWEGTVEPLGLDDLTIAGKNVAVNGWGWTSPEGRSTFWYSDDGWLVRYQTRILGHEVQGILREPPPPGPDAFPVSFGRPKVEILDL